MLELAKVAVMVEVPDKLAFARVKFPTDVVVLPKVIVVLPRVAVLFANPELGMVVAAVTLPVLALPYKYPVNA